MADLQYTSDEMMTIAAARMVRNGTSCFVGIGLPSAAANLARLTHVPDTVLIYESGTIGTKPNILPLSIGDGELAETADAVVGIVEIFNYWLMGERIGLGFLGAAQIDKYANLNSTVIGPYAYGAEEGRRLNHEHLGTEHLLLGLLREEKCFAAGILHERGLQLAPVRDKVASDESTHSDPDELDKFRSSLVAYFTARQKEWGVTVVIEPHVVSDKPDISVYADSGHPPFLSIPFLCIEVISSDDRFRELQERLDDYLADGVRYVWLLDPSARRAYMATTETGLREVKDTVLRTENPALDLPLDAVFT